MEQVKIFTPTPDGCGLENSINDWLKEKGYSIEVIRVLQSQSSRIHIVISIFYKNR